MKLTLKLVFAKLERLSKANCDYCNIYFWNQNVTDQVFESGSHSRRRRTTALLTAVHYGHHETVDAILLLNGDITVADHKGRGPLHHAIKKLVNAWWIAEQFFGHLFMRRHCLYLIQLLCWSIMAPSCKLTMDWFIFCIT